jgi:hypothetical protein
MRPPPYPKKLDKDNKIFFYYKLDPANYSLFDYELNTPMICGSKALVDGYLTQLPEDSVIYYYERDNRTGWKFKMSYKPNKQVVPKEDAKEKLKKQEELDKKKKNL